MFIERDSNPSVPNVIRQAESPRTLTLPRRTFHQLISSRTGSGLVYVPSSEQRAGGPPKVIVTERGVLTDQDVITEAWDNAAQR